ITRAQMAALLTRARNLPTTSRSHFTDVAGSPHAAAINALAAAGITGGCGNDRFCPNHPVSRGQMATFLQRAWSLPDPPSGLLSRPSDTFTDIATSQHRTAINAIAQADITRGCSNNRYCPNQGVTRAEMASFLARTMNLV
ncbi:MAG: S-layer homology domain-containing protein, partial [Egibacteraceae bacterium]